MSLINYIRQHSQQNQSNGSMSTTPKSQTTKTVYGWVNRAPIATELTQRFQQGNPRSLDAFNKLIKYDPITQSVDLRHIKIFGSNNEIRRDKEDQLYRMNANGQRTMFRRGELEFFLRKQTSGQDNSAIVIFLDGNVDNMPSSTFARFYYKGIEFKERLNPNMSTLAQGIFKHVSKTKKGTKDPIISEEAYVSVLVLLKKPYQTKKGVNVWYQKKLMVLQPSIFPVFQDLQDKVIDNNNGNFRGVMVKLANIDGEYFLQSIEPDDLPVEVFNEKGKPWLLNQVGKNGGYYALLKASTPTGDQDLIYKIFDKEEHQKVNNDGDVYQTSDFYCTPFDYDKILPDTDIERMRAFYGTIEPVKVTGPDGNEEYTGEVIHTPGVLQKVVERDSLQQLDSNRQTNKTGSQEVYSDGGANNITQPFASQKLNTDTSTTEKKQDSNPGDFYDKSQSVDEFPF